MTILDAGRDEAMAREEAARDEDFWDELMPRAAELVLTSGQATPQMLQRKMRIRWATIQTLLAELAELGVVGPDLGEQPRRVLLGADALPGVLAAIAGDPEDEVAPVVEGVVVSPGGEDDEAIEATNVAPPATPPATPVVVLTKTSPPPGGDQGGEPATHHPATPPDTDGEGGDSQGGELVVRPDDEVATWQPGELEPWRPAGGGTLGGRVQETWWRVIDHPATTHTKAVTRQLPQAGGRLLKYTPRGIARLTGMTTNALFATHTAAMVARIADTDPLGEAWVKASAEHGKVHERLATRRWLAGGLAFLATLVGLAWWAPTTFAGILAVVVFVGVVAFARGVCRNPSELATCVAVAAGGAAIVWFTGPDLASLVPRPYLPWWGWAALVVGGVAICGWHGRHEDQPLMNLANMAPHKPPIITAPMVIDALCSLGNSKMKEPDEIRVIMDPHQAGAGVQMDLELPKAVPATFVVKNREQFAGALRHPLGCVWPAVGHRHPSHLRVYVSEQPMAQARQKPWPLANGGAVDIFKPLPLVTDQRGDWADLTLAYAAMIIGAQPRMGKTFFLRQCLLVAGLEVRCKVAAMDGKGTGDLSPTRLFADFYSVGDDPEEIEERVLPFLRGLRAEMRRRAKFIRNLPHDQAPESKVTSELVDRYPHLAPWVVGMDETQSYFSYGDKKNPKHKAVREEIVDIVTDLVKRGPALGMWMEAATQNVSEETIPRPISLNAVIRAALKLFDDSANNMVLGAGAYGKGFDATQFDFTDKGLMWLRGDGDQPFIGRSVVGLDMVASERLAAKARALRIRAGTLSGEAAGDGEIEAEVVYDVVQDVERVMSGRGCGKAQWGELVPWLQELRGQYAALTEEELSASIRSAGVRVRDVRSSSGTRRGVYISDLREPAGGDDAD